MKRSLHLFAALVAMFAAAVTTHAQTPTVTGPTQVTVSAPLTSGSDDTDGNSRHVHHHGQLPGRGDQNGDQDNDDDTQGSPGPVQNTIRGAEFAGVGALGYAPPDTNMAVGPNHIVQTVNSRYAIYNKTGGLLVGPNSLSSLWSALGSGNGCATNNGGDVVAQYDRMADRFVITQLGGTSAPFSECIAVSKTNDPTGAYYLYSYNYGTNLNDYPKFGVWPTATNSAYLATYNMFANAATFTGGRLCAYDRTKMLAGDPSAQEICFDRTGDGGYLPADLDGSAAPLDGTPGYFLNYETLSSLRLYAFSPNFANPAASTLLVQSPDLAVTGFSEACSGGGTCIPQSGTTQKLDSLGDRLMYRLAFRRFGDHEALVVNHSVTAGTSVGVRWYELRAPVSNASTWSVFQQGTYAPDATFRWMGSAAMDQAGDIAIGYSASSTAVHPAIRYAGRTPTDSAGVLGTEVSMLEGGGSQTGGLSRWGDYTAMRIDPSDDCTFWYTNEYLPSNGSFNWSTFFGSFKFAGCGAPPAPDFSLSANPTSLTGVQGFSGGSTITVGSSNGFVGSVGLSVGGCPATATCSMAGTTVTAPGTAQLSVITTASTPVGTYTLTITGTSGAQQHTTTVTLKVDAAPSDFTITASPAPPTALVISRGSSGKYTVTIAPITGGAAVTLSLSGLPNRTSASFSPNPVGSPGSSTLTITANRPASTGTWTLTITGKNGTATHTFQVTLRIQ